MLPRGALRHGQSLQEMGNAHFTESSILLVLPYPFYGPLKSGPEFSVHVNLLSQGQHASLNSVSERLAP